MISKRKLDLRITDLDLRLTEVEVELAVLKDALTKKKARKPSAKKVAK